MRAVITAAAALLAWALGSCWYINDSERFYFAVPITALALILTGQGSKFWRRLCADLGEADTSVRRGLAMFVGVLVIGVCSMSWVFGPRVLASGKYWLEFVTSLYLIAAVLLVIVGYLVVLLRCARLVAVRCPQKSFAANVLCPGLAWSLFILVAIPFGVAFTFNYRVKLPNVADPLTDTGRPYEDVEFTSADGTLLRGWWVPARSPSARTIVFCHGLAANRTQTLKFHEIGDWLEANMLVFDMRGHGDSAGRAGSLGYRERDDVLAAIDYVRAEHPRAARQVVGMGVSLGAAVLADVAGELEQPLAGLILDSGFTSTGEMTHSLPQFFRGWLLTIGLPIANWNAGCSITDFQPVASIARARGPVVLLHCRHDFITPSEHSRRLYEQAVEPKQLAILDIGGHCNAYFERRQEYEAAIRTFAQRLPK